MPVLLGGGGFVSSLLGFFFCAVPILGLVLSIVGMSKCGKNLRLVKSNPRVYSGGELWSAGRTLGILGLVFSLLIFLFIIIGAIIAGGIAELFDY